MLSGAIEFGILGPLEVRNGRQLVTIGPPKQRALLVALLLNANRVVSADQLLDYLWGDSQPANGVKALRFHVSRLRASLREASDELAALLVTQSPGYRLDVHLSRIDAHRFDEAVRKARSLVEVAPAEASARLVEALAEWRGPALADVAFEEFAQSEIRRLEEARLAALVDRIDADLASGAGSDIVGEVESLVAEHPTNEQLWAHLMLALHRAGRTQEALDAFQRARTRLVAAGLSPSEPIRVLESRIVADDPSLRPDVRVPTPGLPTPVTELIGRERELAQIAWALRHRRLVTLTGPGGIGKTSVALEAAQAVANSGRSVGWVPLDSLSDLSSVASQLAAVLDIETAGSEPDLVETLRSHLRLWPMVLVFDDCDQAIDGLANLATSLVVTCPEIAILVTSREALRAVGEQVIPIGPLPIPDAYSTLEEAGPAVELFVARARSVNPDFTPSAQNALAVRRLCRQLEGVPLAIELAAAHTAVITPNDLADRLDIDMNHLTATRRGGPRRHHSLTATLEWSYYQLTALEQLLLGRLSVFDGPFRSIDAESICGYGDIEAEDIVPLLSELVAKSFVSRQRSLPSASFRLLDVVKAFAISTLERPPEPSELAGRHADHFARVAGKIRPIRSDLELLTAIEPNIIQALDHKIDRQDWVTAAGIVRSCTAALLEIGRGSRILQRAGVILANVDNLPSALAGTVQWAASNVAEHLDQQIELLRGAIATLEVAGIPTAGPIGDLGQRLLQRGRLEESVAAARRALAETVRNPNQPGRISEWSCRFTLADALIRTGELDEARDQLEQCDREAEGARWEYHGEADLGWAELQRLDGDLSGARDRLIDRIHTLSEHPHLDPWFEGSLHTNLARIEMDLGLHDEADAHIKHALRQFIPSLDIEACDALAVAASLAERNSDWHTAAFIVGGLNTWITRRGLVGRSETMAVVERPIAKKRSQLDPATYAAHFAAGAQVPPIALIERVVTA